MENRTETYQPKENPMHQIFQMQYKHKTVNKQSSSKYLAIYIHLRTGCNRKFNDPEHFQYNQLYVYIYVYVCVYIYIYYIYIILYFCVPNLLSLNSVTVFFSRTRLRIIFMALIIFYRIYLFFC